MDNHIFCWNDYDNYKSYHGVEIVVSFGEYSTWEVKTNMSYLQFMAPSGFEYRIYNDHISVSASNDMCENINRV